MLTNNNPNLHLSLCIPLNLLEECFHVNLNAISTSDVGSNTTIHSLFLFLWNKFCKNTESICHDLLLNISDHSYWRDVILAASLNPVSERWEQNAKMLIHASKMSCPIHCIIDALLIWRENRSSHSSTIKSTAKTYAFSSHTQQILGNLKESMLYDIIILRILLLFCESLEPDQLTNALFAKIVNIVISIIARSADEQLYIKFSFVPSLYLSSKILSTLSAIHFQSTIEAIFQQLSAIRSQPPLSTLLILSLRYIQLKVYPLECLDQTSYSLYQCCKYFDQQSANKLDWAILLNHWIIKLIPSIHAEMNIPSISKPIDQLRERALKYAFKAKTIPESLELVSTLLCITKRDVFMKQFFTTIDELLSRIIKDKSKSVRQTAFISLSRLIWVYLYLHSQSNYSEVTSSLVYIIKKLYIYNDQQTSMKRIVFYPPDLPNYFHIRLLGIIGYKCIEILCSEVGFPFLSSSLQFDTLFKIPLWISNIYEFVEQWFTINHQHNELTPPPLTAILQRDWQCFEYSHVILCSFLHSLHSNVSVSLPPFPLESPIVSPDYSYWNKHERTAIPYLDSEKEWHDIGSFAQVINTIEFLAKYENYFNNCPFTRQQSVDKCIRSLIELVIPLDKLLPALIESSFEEKLFTFLYQDTPGIQILQQRESKVFKSMAIIDALFGAPRHHHDRKGSTYSLETQRLSPSETTLTSSTLRSSFLLPTVDTIKSSRTMASSDISTSTHPIIEGTFEWISNIVSIIPLVLYHYSLVARLSFHPMALSPTSQDPQIQLPKFKKLMLIKIVLLGCAFPSSSLVHQRSKISLKCIIGISQDYISEILAILDDWIEQSSSFVTIERKSTVLDVYMLTLSIISSEFLKSDIKYTNQLLYRYLDLLFSPFMIRKYALILSKYLEIVSLNSFTNILDDSIQYNNYNISISQCILENDDAFWCKIVLPWLLRKYISIMDQYEVLQTVLVSLSKVALYRLVDGLNKLANQNGILPNKVKLFLSTKTTGDTSSISWRDSHSKMQKQDILIQLETDMITSTILSSRILESIIPEIFISFFQFYYGRGTQGMLFYSIGQTDESHSHITAPNILAGIPSTVSYNQLYTDIDFPNLYFVIPSQMRKRFFEYLSWIHPKWIKTFLHEWCYEFHLIGILSIHSDSSTLLKTSFITNSPIILMICDWMNLLIKYVESNASCSSFLLPALSSIISILQHVESHNRWETIQLKNHFNNIVHCILEHPTSIILIQSRPDLISKFFQYFLDHMCKSITFAPGTKELSGTKEQRIMIIQHFDRTSQKMDEVVLECLILLTRYHEIIKNHSIQGALILKHPLRKTWTLPILSESENRKSSICTTQQSIASSNQSFNTTEEEFLGLFSWMDQFWSLWIIPLLFRQPYSGIRALSNYLAFSSHFPYDDRSWNELLYIIWSMIRELKDGLIPDRQYSIDLLYNILVSICNAFEWNLEQLALYTLEPITDRKYCWLNHHHFVNRSNNVLIIKWIISWWHLFRSIRDASKNYPSIRILLDISQHGLRLLSELFAKLCESDMIVPIYSIFSNTNIMNESTLEKVLSGNTMPSCLSTICSLVYISESCKWIQYDSNHNQLYYDIDWNLIFEAVKSALNNPISLLPLIRHVLYLSIATMSPWYLYNANDTFDVIYNNMPKHAQQLSKQVVDVWKYIFDNRSRHRIALLQFLLHHALSDGSKNTILCILLTYLHIYQDVRLSFQSDLLIISLKDSRNNEILTMNEHFYCTCCYPWDGNEPGLSYLSNILTKPETMSYSDLSLNWLLISFIMWPDISLLNPDFIFYILHPKSTIPSLILSCIMRKMLNNADMTLSANNLANLTVIILNRYDNPINPFLSYGLFCRCMSILLNETHIKMIHLNILPILDGLLIYIIDKSHIQRIIQHIGFLFKHSFSLLLLEYQSIGINPLVSHSLLLYKAILERSISVLLRDTDICNIVIQYGYEWFWSIIGKNNDRDCMIDIILVSLLKSVLRSDNFSIYSEIFHSKKILSLPLYCMLGFDKPEWIELLIELMRFFKGANVDSKSNTQIVLIIIGISIICHCKLKGKSIETRLVEELESLDINNLASSFINSDNRDDTLVFQFVNTFRKVIRSSSSFVESRDHDLLLCILFARYHIIEQNDEIGHQIFKSILSSVIQGDLPGSPISMKQGYAMKNIMIPRIEGLCYFILRYLLDNKNQSCLEYLYMMNDINILQDRDNIDASPKRSIYVILYNQLHGSVYSNDNSEMEFIGLLKRRVEYPWES